MSALKVRPLPSLASTAATPAGEIITWTAGASEHLYSTILTALRESGLEEKVARDMHPRYAFNRACKNLSDERIIRKVSEDATTIQFQFTKESLQEGRFSYDFEAMLSLTKATGEVTCAECPALAVTAKEFLDKALASRSAGDITRMVQRLFDLHADLFPIRDQGGAYFVPQSHIPFVEKVESFLTRLGGKVNRFPITSGTPQGDRSVKASVVEGLAALVAEHEEAVASFGRDTRPSTLEAASERISVTRFKLEAYTELLQEQKDHLVVKVEQAREKLKARVELLGAVRDADCSVDCDHCGAPNPVSEGVTSLTCAACRGLVSVEW